MPARHQGKVGGYSFSMTSGLLTLLTKALYWCLSRYQSHAFATRWWPCRFLTEHSRWAAWNFVIISVRFEVPTVTWHSIGGSFKQVFCLHPPLFFNWVEITSTCPGELIKQKGNISKSWRFGYNRTTELFEDLLESSKQDGIFVAWWRMVCFITLR